MNSKLGYLSFDKKQLFARWMFCIPQRKLRYVKILLIAYSENKITDEQICINDTLSKIQTLNIIPERNEVLEYIEHFEKTFNVKIV